MIGVLATPGLDDTIPVQSVDQKYLDAIRNVANAEPLVLPLSEGSENLAATLSVLDGILLTGGLSNVHPSFYIAAEDIAAHEPFDIQRDKTAFAIIDYAIRENVPVLGICRGMQELNVFCGGTLMIGLQNPEALPHHRPWDREQPIDTIYQPFHTVETAEDGVLRQILKQLKIEVNSIHKQGIERLGEGLRVEARAEDGVIEAISRPESSFVVGVQWHPEYQAATNATSSSLFAAFGRAAATYRAQRPFARAKANNAAGKS